MKFIHLGDLHLGKLLLDYNLLDDQEYMLNEIIRVSKEESVDAILIAGDVYDKSVPSEAAVSLLDSFLRKLSMSGIRVYLISGNHDSDERLNFGRSFFTTHGIHIGAKYEGILQKEVFEDAYGPVNIYLMPFVKASQVRAFFPEEKIENYEDAVKTIIKHADVNTNERNLILSHQFVAHSTISGSEGMSVTNVGTVEQISASCFDPFDYAALGHIHKVQHIGREEVRYSGSLLKYSLKEAEDHKSFPLVTLGEKGDVQIELVELKPRRDVRHLRGELLTLIKEENIVDPDDYIYATLTDEEPIPDALSIFKQYYKNTVRLDYDNSHTKGLQEVDFENVTGNKSFEELISEFYHMTFGQDISEEELQIMKEVAKETGVLYEAD